MGKIKVVIFLMSLVVLSAFIIPGQFITAMESKQVEVTKSEAIEVAEFKGEIFRDLETHYFMFTTTKPGIIDVDWKAEVIGADFIITDEHWSTMYWNGSELPAGDYMFVVTTNPAESPDDPVLVPYDFVLKGLTFERAPDTSLPSLEVKNPEDYRITLPEGEQSIVFKGKTDGVELRFGLFETDLPDKIVKNNFKEKVTFSEGSPFYSAYRITAINEGGNRVNKVVEVIYSGGTME